MVLAGGGLTGAVYEIGALRAIDDLLIDRTVNDFDLYVGTSAGALVSALLANGLSPEEMLQAIANDHPDIPPMSRSELLHFDPGDLLRLGIKIPQTIAGAVSHFLRHLDDMTMFDVIWSLSETLPSGFWDNLATERYVRRVLTGGGRSNHFADVRRELYLIATDLDNGQRVVFGPGHHDEVPISLAVAASSALPVMYKPVRIGQHDYVDGGLRGNASLDIAVENGATLLVCINPIVPYDNSDLTSIPFLGPDGGHLSDKGFPAIASQVGRIGSHAGLHYHLKQMRHKHPGVDVILIEPSIKDYQMFFYNIMRFSAQMIVARHGFESVTLRLAEDYQHYKDLLSRHHISITRRLVNEELEEIRRSDYSPVVIRRILEARSGSYGRHGRRTARLRQTLGDLDQALSRLADDSSASRLA